MIATARATEDRTAWLRWRRGGLGASDAAAIAGLDPYRGAMSVWLDKTDRLPLESGDEREYMQWGNLLEPAIADEFERRTGLFVPHRALMLEHSEYPWMRATVDGLVCDNSYAESPLGPLEIKVVAGFKQRNWDEGIPDHFQLQIQHQLAVCGSQHAWLAVLFGGQKMEIRELERDDDLIASLIRLESDFWTKHVIADVPPGADGSEAATTDLRIAFGSGGGGEVDLPEDVEELIEQRRLAKNLIKSAEASCREAEQSLMSLLGDAEVGLMGGRPRVTWKRAERKEYTVKATSYRVLRVVGKAGDEGDS